MREIKLIQDISHPHPRVISSVEGSYTKYLAYKCGRKVVEEICGLPQICKAHAKIGHMIVKAIVENMRELTLSEIEADNLVKIGRKSKRDNPNG